MRDIKSAIREELSVGAVCGRGILTELLSDDYVGEERTKLAEIAYRKVRAATDRLSGNVKGQRVFFKDLEEEDIDSDYESVYAFFVLVEI